MKKIIFCICFVSFLAICTNAFAWRFTGATIRWPSNQTKSIVTRSDYVYIADGDTLTVFRANTMEYHTHIRLPIKKSEGIYALVPDDRSDPEILYAACGTGGIHVIDISNPASPTTNGTTAVLESEHRTIKDDENYTNNPDPDKATSKLNAFDISIHDTLMYVADNDYGIRMFSITGDGTDPSDTDLPGLQTSDNLIRSVSVYASGGTAQYIVALTAGDIRYYKLDADGKIIEDTLKYSQVSSTGGLASLNTDQAQIKTGYVYFTDQTNRNLYIFDIASAITAGRGPTQLHPAVNTQYDSLSYGFPRGFVVRNNALYMTSFYPENEGPVDSGSTNSNAPAGLHILDISSERNPVQRTTDLYELEYANNIAISGSGNTKLYAYLYSLSKGLFKVDVTPGTNEYLSLDPSNQSGQHTVLNAADVHIAYEYAFVADGKAGSEYGFSIINVDTPSEPFFEEFFETPGQANSIYIEADGFRSGVIADGTAGIQVMVIDSSTGLLVPEILKNADSDLDALIPVPDGMSATVVTGVFPRYHVIAVIEKPGTPADNQIWTIDVLNNPRTPGVPAKLNVPGAINVHAYDIYGFVSAGSNGIKIYKVLDRVAAEPPSTGYRYIPTETPELITILDEPDYSDVRAICTGSLAVDGGSVASGSSDTVEGMYAFVADGTAVRIIEIYSDAFNFSPRVVNTIDISEYGIATDIVFSKKTIYVLADNDDDTLLVYDVTDPLNPALKDTKQTYGDAAGIDIYDIKVVDDTDVTGQRTVKAVYVAENSGYLSIHETTEEEENPPERIFTNDSDMLCFTKTVQGSDGDATNWIYALFFGTLLLSVTIRYGIRFFKKESE